MGGQARVQSLDAGLHSTNRALKKKIINGRHTVGRDTRITSFSQLHVRMIGGQPLAHVIATDIEISTNDEAETSGLKFSNEVLKPPHSDVRVLVPVKGDKKNLPQVGMLDLNGHGPMAGNHRSGVGNFVVDGPQEPNTPRSAIGIASGMSGGKTTLIP